MDKAKDPAGDAVEATKDAAHAVAEKTEDVVEAVKENDTVEAAVEKGKGLLGTVGDKLKDAATAAVNVAENITNTDLNKDGTVGGKTE